MHATVGDRIVVHGLHVGDPNRDGEVVEVRDPSGCPPYLVRWSDTGHESLLFPGAGTHIAPLASEHAAADHLR